MLASGHRWLATVAGVLALAGCGASDPRSLSANAIIAKESPAAEAAKKSIGMVAAALPAAMAAVVNADATSPCKHGMVSIEGRYCIDKYEASLVETDASGEERPYSPYSSVGKHHVRAVSEPNVYPQGYISETEATDACAASGKRLCKASEWQLACKGPEKKQWGYGDSREVGRCNDNGKNPVMSLFGPRYDAKTMNRSQLNQMDGTLAKTGEHGGCSNGYGVYDMVGNLHEWIADANGTFNGGYYQDVVKNGEGCGYQTKAHEARYHDYSTGFRCCADLAGETPEAGKATLRSASVAPKAIPGKNRVAPKNRRH